MMGDCTVTLVEERRKGRYRDTHHFSMFVSRINGEDIQSWIHEFTEMGVYFALVDMNMAWAYGDLGHILACFTCGAYNHSVNEYWSADKVWERRKEINFSIEAVLPLYNLSPFYTLIETFL